MHAVNSDLQYIVDHSLIPSEIELFSFYTDNLVRQKLFKPLQHTKRGFTIRLKRLKPRSPDFRGPQNFGSKDNFQHFCKQLCLYFCFDSTHVFSPCH